jgi:WhiB family redox-sensing transcriptional regulator
MSDVGRLPAPSLEQWEWQLSAACRGIDSDVFFHLSGVRGAARSRREKAAKEICATCPVIQDCLAWALRVREPYGVWGGKTPDERAILLHQPTRCGR